MKKVIFYSFDNYSPFLEINLELIQKYLNKNYYVYYFFLGQKIFKKYNFIWPKFKSLNKNLNFLLPEIRGLGLIFNKKNLFYSDNLFIKKHKIKCNNYSFKNFKKITYRNFDVGESILSTLISSSQNSNLKLNSKKQDINELFSSSINIYEKVLTDIDKINPQQVIVFNGRLLYPRAVIRACQSKRVKFASYDTGVSNYSFRVRDYDFTKKKIIQKKMHLYWKNFGNKNKFLNEYKNWFKDRRIGSHKRQIDTSYILDQNKDFKKKNKKKLITYFTSSDDERLAQGPDWINYFGTQEKAIGSLIDCINFNKYDLVIRIHPNIKNKSKDEKNLWVNIKKKYSKNKNISFILPEEKTRSYSILDQSDIIVSSGSTIGLEAVYYKKPSILLSPSPYDFCKGFYIAKNKKEIKKLLNSKLVIKNKNIFMPIIFTKLYEGIINYKYTTKDNKRKIFFFRGTKLKIPKVVEKILSIFFRIY